MASMGLLGALGGLGEAGVSVGKQMFLDASRSELEERRMEYLLEKQKQLDKIAADRKDTERTEMVERVSGAKAKILEEDTLRNARTASADALKGTFRDDNGELVEKDLGSAKDMLKQIQAMPEGKEKQELLGILGRQMSEAKGKAGLLNSEDLTDEQRSRFAPTREHEYEATVRAGIETGDIKPLEAGNMLRQDRANEIAGRRLDREERRDEQRAEYEDARIRLAERGLDIRETSVSNAIRKSGSVSAFVQQFNLLKVEKPDWSNDQILEYMNRGKTPVATETTRTKTDQFGSKETETTIKGPASPASGSSDAMVTFMGRKAPYSSLEPGDEFITPDGRKMRKK